MTESKSRQAPAQQPNLLPLGNYLETNQIPWPTYVVNLMKGLAPPPIVIGDEVFLDRGDEAAYRTRLRAEALRRVSDLASKMELTD
jgi:hypothetical protein